MTKETALIAMSGGVDSSVAAHLTLREGLNCLGATMELLDGGCSSQEAIRDAEAVAQRLGIPFRVFPLREDFRKEVMEDFVRCYETGLTPTLASGATGI